MVDISHDIDGAWTFDVFAVGNSTLELYNRRTDTSYFLDGYQRRNFDYDRLFYENIHYLLQEFDAWEKTFTSEVGAVIEFDDENFLRFFGDNGGYFQSSIAIMKIIVKIIMYHVASVTVYEFTGRGFVQYLKSKEKVSKKRTKSSNKKMNVERKRKM